MTCPQCEMENAEGALYCARCHHALPRPLATGECPYCGQIANPLEGPSEVCLTCGNDAGRGAQIRADRAAALRAAWESERLALESRITRLNKPRTRPGCLPALLLAGLVYYLLNG